MMDHYPIPSASVRFKEEIKKSRFITHLAHTPGVEAAKSFVQQIKTEHATARHNCWAFVAGAPSDSMQLGFSDDGEPSGTAGKPILAQLQGSGVGEITAVVTRYSGGIKLGTGGLVSAYGGGVGQALAGLNTTVKITMKRLQLHFDYSEQKRVEQVINLFGATIINADYSAFVDLRIEIAKTEEADFLQKLSVLSKNNITIIKDIQA